MPLPSSSLVAIQDQLLVAKNNNNLVAPPPPPVSSCVIPGELEHRGTAGSQPPQVGLSGCFSSHSAPSARAAAAAGCAGHLRRGLMAQSAGAGEVPSSTQPVHIASKTFFQMEILDGSDGQRGL